MNMSPQVEQFLDSIVDQADQSDMTPELRQKMVQVLAEQLDNHILAAAINQLNDADLEAYQQLIETEPQAEQVQQFLQQHIADLPQLVTIAMRDFKDRYLETVDE